MDIRLQAKLLRAIQEREIDRLGGSSPVRVDIRLIATSNRDLEQHVRDGKFREDLYFRLNVFNLQLPPLRERPRDIRALAEFFAKKYADANGLPGRPLTEAALQPLARHHWPAHASHLATTLHPPLLLGSGRAPGPDEIPLTGQHANRPAGERRG